MIVGSTAAAFITGGQYCITAAKPGPSGKNGPHHSKTGPHPSGPPVKSLVPAMASLALLSEEQNPRYCKMQLLMTNSEHGANVFLSNFPLSDCGIPMHSLILSPSPVVSEKLPLWRSTLHLGDLQ